MKRKGKNMKKALGILSVLVLITVMLVSCNAEQNVNDTVEVSFNVSSSRALTVTNQEFISVDSPNLTWYYHGEKKTDTEFKTGQSGTGDDYWTLISTENGLANTKVEFSQGQWSFEVKANNENGIQMYYGKTNGNVLLTKENTTISISVSPFVSGVKGTLVLNGVYIKPADGNPPKVAPNRLFINGVPRDISISNGATSLSYTEQVEPGTYTVEVQRVGTTDTGVVLASASKTVVVYSGLTTTIEGSVEEDTTTGTFVPQPIKPEGTETVTVPTTGDAVVKFVNVTPSMKADKSTTVTIPSAVVTSTTGPVTLDIVVKDSESVADNSFKVTTNYGVAASISLTMKDGDTAKTDFGSNKVTVETYIETGLSGVTVKYNGDGTTGHPDPEETTYVPETGRLTFKTTHFSEFYVEAEIVARIGEKGYITLQKAFDSARDNSIVLVLKNIDVYSPMTVDSRNNITLDLNGKKIEAKLSGVGGKNPLIYTDATSLEIKDSAGTGNIVSDEYGITASNGGTITITNGTIEAGNAVLAGNNTTGDMNFIINGGTLTSKKSEAIYMPGQQTLTITGGTINGGISARMGQINISGGEINGMTADQKADSFDKFWNYSGSAWIGDAIYVWGGTYTSANTYGNSCNINITGGTINGNAHNAIAVYDIANKYDQKIAVNISDDAVVNGTIVEDHSHDQKKTNVTTTWRVSGGTFSTDPSEYLAFGYVAGSTSTGYVVSKSTSSELNINNANQLIQFAESVNNGNNYVGKTIILNRDIDLNNEEWTPIGQKAGNKFAGVFDGNNKTISGLSITENNIAVTNTSFDNYVGLFGAIENGTLDDGTVKICIVKNLTVSGSVIGKNAAGIVARMESGIIENCESNVMVLGTNKAGKAGGIVCLTNTGNCTIKNCINNGSVKGVTDNGVGGIAAYVNANTTISGCTNNAEIGSNTDKYSGGIAGYVTSKTDNILIDDNCTNTGSVTAYQDAGGIVGIITGLANITNCSNSGAINAGENGNGGGIAGSTKQSNITECINTASVYGKYAGGVIGVDAASTITNCSGGNAAITSPAHVISFTGQRFTLSVDENKSTGRILGAHMGAGPDKYTVLVLDDNNGDSNTIPTVGICGNTTTMAILKISSGTFYGDPLAGNESTIILEDGARWGSRVAETYKRGGLNESSRIAEWTCPSVITDKV